MQTRSPFKRHLQEQKSINPHLATYNQRFKCTDAVTKCPRLKLLRKVSQDLRQSYGLANDSHVADPW